MSAATVRSLLNRGAVVAFLMVLVSALATGSVIVLETRSGSSRDARLVLAQASGTFNDLQNVPWEGDPRAGGSPTATRASMRTMEAAIAAALARLRSGSPLHSLDSLDARLHENYTTLDGILRAVAARGNQSPDASRLGYAAIRQHARIDRLIDTASAEYAHRADVAREESLAGSAVAVLGLATILVLLYRRERARASQEARQLVLAERERELRRLLADLEQAQHDRALLLAQTVEIAEHERMRVARDLHDGPIQSLTAVALGLDALALQVQRGRADGLDERREQIRSDVAGVMVSLRRLMVELRPPVLDERGIGAALRDAAAELLDGGPAYDVRSELDGVVLAPEVETVAYRVAREALANVRKHAAAGRVEIAIEDSGDTVALTIADDGVGFEPGVLEGSRDGLQLGLIGMRERVESVGGRLLVSSAPGSGTRVEARLPVGAPATRRRAVSAAAA